MPRVTITLSEPLYEVAEILRRKNKYRSMSEYFVALVRCDSKDHCRHDELTTVASLNGYERDRLDAAILNSIKHLLL